MRLRTLSFMIVMLPKVPIMGSKAITVRAICVEALCQFKVMLCVAVIATVPPSRSVTVLPIMEATAEFEDE